MTKEKKEKKEKKPPVLWPAQESGRTGSPLLWVLLLAVPLTLGLAVSIVRGMDGATPPLVAPGEIAAAAQPAVTQELTVTEEPVEEGGPRRIIAMPKEEAYPCDFAPWVGSKVTPEMLEAIKQAKRGYRILSPGASMTMDYSPARINFETDGEGVITRVSCG